MSDKNTSYIEIKKRVESPSPFASSSLSSCAQCPAAFSPSTGQKSTVGLSRTSWRQWNPLCYKKIFNLTHETDQKRNLWSLLTPGAVPVSSEGAERRRPVAAVVHVAHGARRAALGQNLLILSR